MKKWDVRNFRKPTRTLLGAPRQENLACEEEGLNFNKSRCFGREGRMNSVEEEQQRKKGIAVSERSSGGIRFFFPLKGKFCCEDSTQTAVRANFERPRCFYIYSTFRTLSYTSFRIISQGKAPSECKEHTFEANPCRCLEL